MKAFVAGLALACVLVARVAWADSRDHPAGPPLEPPPEAADGDYTLEAADTLADEELELMVGAAGGGRGVVRRAQRVSFRGGGARGTLRDGDDVLAGGRVDAPLAGGRLAAGRLSPRWARGLVMGGAAEPWGRGGEDRGERAAYRGRAGNGLGFEAGHLSVLAGRFGRADLCGARVRVGAGALGLVAARRGAQLSAGWEGARAAFEFALGARGRWRAESALTGDAGGTRLALRVRGGLGAYRPIAEPVRAGPPEATSLSALREWGAFRTGAFGSLWLWRRGLAGARGALEVATRPGGRGSWAAGLEQQQGARREPSPRARRSDARQGLWCEWRGGPPGSRLTLRHELWGERAFARSAVRRALVARAEFAAPRGARIGLTHAVWRVRPGENLYLPEPESDRLVLRALAGTGTRTKVELRAPFAPGDIRVGVTLITGGRRAGDPPPAWTVQWSRRSRFASERARTP